MAPFSALPAELIGLIAEFVNPADVISFAIISKHIFTSSERALQTHRKFQKRYHELDHRRTYRPKWPSLTSILREMILIPRASLYVKIARLSLGAGRWEDRITGRPTISESESCLFRQPLISLGVQMEIAETLDSEFQGEDEMIVEAADSICQGDDRFTSILLLSSLANLTLLDLAVDDNWGFSVDFLVPLLRRKAVNVDPSILANLYTVTLAHVHDDWMQHILLEVFLSFPSVRTIHAAKVTGPDDYEIPPEWSLPLVKKESNLSTLTIDNQEEIIDNRINPIGWLHDILQSTPHLKTFKWWCQGPDGGPRYSTGDIIKILGRHVSQSLEELFISVYNEIQDMQNLPSLLALQKLEIGYGDFLPDDDSPALDLFRRLPPKLRHLRLWDTENSQLVRDLYHFPDMIRNDLQGSTMETIDLDFDEADQRIEDLRIMRHWRAAWEASDAYGITISFNLLHGASMPKFEV